MLQPGTATGGSVAAEISTSGAIAHCALHWETLVETDVGMGYGASAGMAGPVDARMTQRCRQDGRLSGKSEPGPNGVAVVVQAPFGTSLQALPW